MEDFPEKVLANVVAYLDSKIDRVLMAVALTAPESSWEQRGWKETPSVASKIVMATPYHTRWSKATYDESWQYLELCSRKEDRLWLSDGILCGILVCTNAVSNLTALELPGCVAIHGHGLSPLRGSTVLARIDLSLAEYGRSPAIDPEPKLSEDVVVRILRGILDNEGSSLKYLRLPKAWRDRKSAVLGDMLDKVNRAMNNREISCSKCGSLCIGTGERPWIPREGEGYGVQNFTCHDCLQYFCEACGVDAGICRICPCCEEKRCNDCGPVDKCSVCNKVSCGGCNYFCTCRVCGTAACDDCRGDTIRPCCSCYQYTCTDCQSFLTCRGSEEKSCHRSTCLDCVQKDTQCGVKRCTKCEEAFCPQCKAVELCSIIGGDVCRDCHREDHSAADCHWQYLPLELKQLVPDFAAKGLSMKRMMEFCDACIQAQSFGTDKRFDVLAYQKCVQAEMSAYVLAADFLSKGMSEPSVYLMLYCGLLNEAMQGRGPDYLRKCFQEESGSGMLKEERVCTYFGLFYSMVVATTSQAEMVGRLRGGTPFLESMKSNGLDVLKELLGSIEPSEAMLHDPKVPGGETYTKLYGDTIWMNLTVCNKDSGASMSWSLYKDVTLSWMLKAYALNRICYQLAQGQTTLASTTQYFRIVHEERTIFVSSSGKKTMAQLGIQDGDVITVGGVDSGKRTSLGDLSNAPASKKESSKGGKPKKKKGRGGKKKNRKKATPFVLTDDEIAEKQRELHSSAMTRVFEEMGPTLKDIRNRINDLTIHKSAPKARKPSSRLNSQPREAAVSLPMDAASGKAGKVAYPILVGEVSCLYKTNKLSVKRATVLDLHGLSKEEALATLAKSLPVWVDTAMRGEHPWVIPVDIVCGGGSQILSDAVRGWIRSTRQVANRPKKTA